MRQKDATSSDDPSPGFTINLNHLLMDDAAISGIPIRREEPSEKDAATACIPIRKEGPEGPYLEWVDIADRHYTLSSTAFTQRQLYKHEFYTNMYGDLIDYVAWSRERIENERDALIFIAENTTIRVPKVLHFSVENEVASITTAVVDGISMEELTLTLSEEDRATLVSNVSSYINDTVLPQLNKLTSNTLGTVHGNLLPPTRLEYRYLPKRRTKWECKELDIEHSEQEYNRPPKREAYGRTRYPEPGRGWGARPPKREVYKRKRYPWPPVTSATKDYVYCHNYLTQENILIDPKTLQVASIIDWGWSGFFPKGFEFPFWRKSFTERRTPADRGLEDPMIDDLLEVIFGPGEANRASILQSSPILTSSSYRVPAGPRVAARSLPAF